MVSKGEALPSVRKAPVRRMMPRSSSFKKPKSQSRALPRRAVSFKEEGPQIERIASVRHLMCEPDSTEEEIKVSMNELWYDEHEIETGKHESAQLVLENEGTAATDDDDFTLRGLERQTEEGSWAQFQNRNSVLGAVLDEGGDADEVAQRATEATAEARKSAQQRAQQDELEAKAYLADIKDYLSMTCNVLPTQDNAAEDSDEDDEKDAAPKKPPLRRVKTLPTRPDFDWKASARKLTLKKEKEETTEEDNGGDDTVKKDETTAKQDNPRKQLAEARKSRKELKKPTSQDDEAVAAILAIKKKKKGLKRSKSMNAKTLMSADATTAANKEECRACK